VNFVLDGERVAQYGIDRVPAIAVAYEEDGSVQDSRIRFLGAPAGYEFISLVQAVLLVGGAGSILSADNRAKVEAAGHPIVMRVFTTPT
jgi:alkyl hydroperoxide reductase subunit AhpF